MDKSPVELGPDAKVSHEVSKRLLEAAAEERDRKRRKSLQVPNGVLLLDKFVVAVNWKRPYQTPVANFGLSVLLKMRVNAFWTAFRHSTIRQNSASDHRAAWARICPLCGEDTPETTEHLLVDCRKWDEERTSSGLQTLIEELEDSWTMAGRTASEKNVGIDQQPDWGVQLLGGQLLGVIADRYYSADGSKDIFEPVSKFLGMIYLPRLRHIHAAPD